MTTATDAPPAHDTAVGLARGFLTGGVIGVSLAAFVVGCVLEHPPLLVTALALALPTAYGLLLLLAGAPRRAREAAVAPRTALAVIESMEAVPGEVSDVPVRFDLTVAPQDAPAYRVGITQDIHLSELPDYRPRGVLVVRYPPDRPWRVRIVTRPTPEWEERAAGARIDSAPGPAPAGDPEQGRAGGFVTLLGLLLGAAAVVLLFRADLFGPDGTAQPPPPESSGSVTSSTTVVTSSTTVVTSASGTVALGPDGSLLERGALRRAVDSLTTGEATHQALTVVVQERLLTIVYSPGGTGAPSFDPRSLPYDRVPALVEEAGTTLGLDSPQTQTWQLAADRLTGSLTIRVTVTGPAGTASLEADGQGTVVRRSPAR
ncbi:MULTISPECIES: hypothetical protein [unclassified Kitasatospora]|uniref:hypothetical protein n=1 Tax=unclassified Kitasatospora TaxID=2633591 RepID=UPI003404EABB